MGEELYEWKAPVLDIREYRFMPQNDMTPVEAAFIAIVLTVSSSWDIWNHPEWDKVSRHFARVYPNMGVQNETKSCMLSG